jgi:hypothetical protein
MSNYFGIPIGDQDSAVSTLKPYSYLGSVNVSASTTLDATYLGKIITITAPNVVLTLPFAGTTPGFVQLVIRYTGTTGTSSVVTQGSDTISSQTTSSTTLVFNPGDTVELVSNTASIWLNVSSSSASINQDLGNNTDPTKGAALIGYYSGSNVKTALDTLNSEVGANTTSINTLNSEMTSAINGINTLTNARTKYNIAAVAAGQRTFTVPNGYVIGRLEVFMYNTYLVEGTDYTAVDGSTVYLINRKIYNNVQIGDVMTVSALIVYTTIVNPVDSVSLASSGGATLVGYGTQTVKQALDQLNLVRTKYSIAATSNGQTTFTIPNGYIVGRLELFMYNAYLVEGVDYTATDGATVNLINTKLYSAVKTGDLLIASTLLVYSEGQNPVDSTSLASSGGASLIGYGTQTVAQALNNTVLNRQDMYFTNNTTNTITIPGGYQPGFIDVYLNGVRLAPASGLFNASNGTTVVFTHALQATDVVECLTNTAFSFYNGVQASQLASSQAGLGAQMVGYSVGGTVAAALNALLGSPTFVQGTVTSTNQTVLPVSGGYTPGTVRGVITGLGLSLQQSDFIATDGQNVTITNPAITLPIGTTYTVEFYQPYVALQTQINTSVTAAQNYANTAATAAAQALTVVPQVQVLDYPSLRAYNATSANNIFVTGYSGTASPSGIAGTFVVDPTDTTSADNGGTIIVGVGGKRWKRIFSSSVNGVWFGLDTTGTTDVSAALANIIQLVPAGGEFVVTGSLKLSSSVVLKSNIRVNIYGTVTCGSVAQAFDLSNLQNTRLYVSTLIGDNTTTSSNGILLANSVNCSVEIDTLQNFLNKGISFTGTASNNKVYIKTLSGCSGATGAGVSLYGASVTGNVITVLNGNTNRIGLTINGSQYNWVVNSAFNTNALMGLSIDGMVTGAGDGGRYNQIQNVQCNGNGTGSTTYGGFYLGNGSSFNQFSGIIARNNLCAGILTSGATGYQPTDNTFQNVQVVSNALGGVILSNAPGTKISNLDSQSNTGGPALQFFTSDGCYATNVKCSNNTGQTGIVIQSANCKITGGESKGNSTGINIGAGGSTVYTGNIIEGVDLSGYSPSSNAATIANTSARLTNCAGVGTESFGQTTIANGAVINHSCYGTPQWADFNSSNVTHTARVSAINGSTATLSLVDSTGTAVTTAEVVRYNFKFNFGA